MSVTGGPAAAAAGAELDRRGFVVLHGVLDLGWLERLRAAMLAELRGMGLPGRPLTDAELAGLSEDERALVSGNFPKAFKGGQLLREGLESPALRAGLQAALSSAGLHLHMYPSPRHVAPGNRRAAVPRHTDRQYNDHLSRFVTAWVPVDCFAADRGGVIVYAGSHREPTANTARRSEDGLWFEANGAPSGEGELLVLSAGDVLLLHEHLLHESAPNRSPDVRLSVDYRLFGDHATTTRHYYDLQSRAIFAPGEGERHVR